MFDFKRISIFALAAVLLLTLTACMGMTNTKSARPQTTTGFMPETTQAPMSTDQTRMNNGGGMTNGMANNNTFDWTTGAGQIEANVSRISEIDECRVVVVGNTALVGIEFEDAYQGEVTERIREMVAAEVMKADPGIQTVAVTAADDDVDDIFDISDKIKGGGSMAEDLATRIEEIVRNATTLR